VRVFIGEDGHQVEELGERKGRRDQQCPGLRLWIKKRVAVGIGDDGHVADRRFQRLHGEGNARGLKLGDGGLEVLDLKGDGGTHGRLGGGLPKAAKLASVPAPMSASDQKPSGAT
jgi:hypothetical protein